MWWKTWLLLSGDDNVREARQVKLGKDTNAWDVNTRQYCCLETSSGQATEMLCRRNHKRRCVAHITVNLMFCLWNSKRCVCRASVFPPKGVLEGWWDQPCGHSLQNMPFGWIWLCAQGESSSGHVLRTWPSSRMKLDPVLWKFTA